MEEKTLFKLARAITDTGTDTVSSKGGTITYRITSLKRKLVNGKLFGVIGVGYSASINNSDYLLEEDKSDNTIQITALADGTLYKNWIVNQNRYAINVYIASIYPVNSDMLSWSCLDKDGNAFSPNYNLPSNSYFTTKNNWIGFLYSYKSFDSLC